MYRFVRKPIQIGNSMGFTIPVELREKIQRGAVYQITIEETKEVKQ